MTDLYGEFFRQGITVVTASVFASLTTLLLQGLRSYTSEKGKNLATKQDVAELTKKVETVKTHSHFLKVRYEKEFSSYERICAALIAFRDVTAELRGGGVLMLRKNETQEDRKKRMAESFGEAYREVYSSVFHNLPFYDSEISEALRELLKLARIEACHFEVIDRPEYQEKDYWDDARKTYDEIIKQVDDVWAMIRDRVTSFDTD